MQSRGLAPAPDLTVPTVATDGATALELEDVWASYVPGRPVLRGLSLAASEGAVTMVLGVSGSGKTTLLKLCKGLLSPQRGNIRVLGERVAGPRRGRLDPRVAYIPQQLGLVRTLSALDNALTGALSRVGRLPSLLNLFPEPEIREARELMERLGIGRKADERVFALSGGERQRVAIARALMQQPRVLLADEFISDLDPLTSAEIMAIVRDVVRSGVAVVMTTHEMDVVRAHADRVIVLREGEKSLDRYGMPSAEDITSALRR
ncbi:MAG TPA: ATP-binding cassette domain-containing protein [Candidatus Limnocylindria bacterium]|nr:ATP-binding cassette domain-containing protein [Candidatus Limnocylindria bacterium]